jgi:hypothetical protein
MREEPRFLIESDRSDARELDRQLSVAELVVDDYTCCEKKFIDM